jgi:hypothetical protein
MLPRLMCIALGLTLLYAPVSGVEKDRDRDEKKQPELHIRLVVQQPAFAPHHKHRDDRREDTAVIYALLRSEERFSVSEELRSMLIDGTRHEQVQLTTIVLK